MKAQISRLSFRPNKNFAGVYQQQGRMITDADWNELVDVIKKQQQQALTTTVGSGVPRDGGVLEITETRPTPGEVERTAKLKSGSLIVDGIYAEVASTGAGGNFVYEKQPLFRNAPALPAGDVTFYADVWERLVISIQDKRLRDPALHGADTCVRTQVMAQVKHTDDPTQISDEDVNPTIGNAEFDLTKADNAIDPGDPCAAETSLSSEFGNYLFRLEVHDVQGDASAPDSVTLKWSMENAAEAHEVGNSPPEFSHGEWIYEFFGEDTEQHLGVHLNGGPVRRSHLAKTGYPNSTPKDADNKTYELVRRWDGYCKLEFIGGKWGIAEGKHFGEDLEGDGGLPITTAGNLTLRLGDVIMSLKCGGSRFVAGDFWLALSRQSGNEGSVEVPFKTPVGIRHHYLRLLTTDGTNVSYPLDSTDAVRQLSFPPLPDLTANLIDYDPTVAQARWQDIMDGAATPLPDTVQDAIDQLADKFESSDIEYEIPQCAGNQDSVRARLPTTQGVAPGDTLKVDQVLDGLLCELDSGTLPYSRADSTESVKDLLIKRTGDLATGQITINNSTAQPGDPEAPGVNLLDVKGSASVKGFQLNDGLAPITAGHVLTTDNQGNGTWAAASASGWLLDKGNLRTDPALVTGFTRIGDVVDTGWGTQSQRQAASELNGAGYLEVPWIHTRFIEGDSRGGKPTGVALSSKNGYTNKDQIGLITDGDIRLFVSKGGRVGIGDDFENDGPDAKLHVRGNVRVSGQVFPDRPFTNETGGAEIISSNSTQTSWIPLLDEPIFYLAFDTLILATFEAQGVGVTSQGRVEFRVQIGSEVRASFGPASSVSGGRVFLQSLFPMQAGLYDASVEWSVKKSSFFPSGVTADLDSAELNIYVI